MKQTVLVILRETERTPGKRAGELFCEPFFVTRVVPKRELKDD
jgi:hypothetical protein